MSFTLQQFQTLNLEATGAARPGTTIHGSDLTGTAITGDHPFGVYGGHQSANIDESSDTTCCTDHLEEQMFPASAWGKKYVVVHSQPRPLHQKDMIRVLALRDNTTVTFNPAGGTSCPTLASRQFWQVWVADDVEITASQPILVGHYLASSGSQEGELLPGDPSLSLAVPVEQYRSDYQFLVPSQYDVNYVSLIVPTPGQAMLDGVAVSSQQLHVLPSGDFATGRVTLQAGQHRIVCAMGCGIELTGWGRDVSYMLAGGLNLNQIVIP
jgi:hypothetical protein